MPPRMIAAVDIDGVLADVGHRLRHLEKSPKDWDAFFGAAGDDPVLDEGRRTASALAEGLSLIHI